MHGRRSEPHFFGYATPNPTFSQTYDANNHAGTVDSNGNPASIYLPQAGSSYAATWDVENRLTSTGGGTIFYSYAPGNPRVWKGRGTRTTQSSVGSGSCNTGQWSTDEVDFWGVNGQKLMTYSLLESPSAYYSQCSFTANTPTTNYYFGAKLIKNAGGYVYSDRLGTIGKSYPYGIERPSATTNNTEKFTGYYRDLETGNDYSINRYMSPGFGRFFTPDPSQGAYANPANPGSWNLYAYAKGDPIGRRDPLGLDDNDCYYGNDSDCGDDSDGDSLVDPFAGTGCSGVGGCGGGYTVSNNETDYSSEPVFSVTTTAVLNPVVTSTLVPSDALNSNAQTIFSLVNASNPGGFINYFMLSAVLAGAGGPLVSGGAGIETVVGFRAVSAEEYRDIATSQQFRPSPGGGIVKYFSNSQQQAVDFGEKMSWARELRRSAGRVSRLDRRADSPCHRRARVRRPNREPSKRRADPASPTKVT